jgi:cilia- and flagella-associated protein 57
MNCFGFKHVSLGVWCSLSVHFHPHSCLFCRLNAPCLLHHNKCLHPDTSSETKPRDELVSFDPSNFMCLSLMNCRHCFGFRPDVRNSLHWIEGHTIAYPVGHSIVVMDTENKSQRFIPCSSETTCITALAVSPNLKHLAIAESAPANATGGPSPAIITIFDLTTLKRRKTLTATEGGNAETVDLHFSPDSRLLLAQGGSPEWNLVLWVWEKARVGSFMRTGSGASSVLSALFCPNDSGLVSILGSNSIKMLRSTDSNLKAGPQPLSKRDPQEYTCQAWVSDGEKEKLAIGCLSGEILLVEALDLKAVMHSEGNAPVDCILPWGKGFMVGQGNGAIAVFERDERECYRRTKVFKLREPAKITSMALSMHDVQIAIAVDTGKVFTLSVGNIEILKPEEDNFELLAGACICTLDLPIVF